MNMGQANPVQVFQKLHGLSCWLRYFRLFCKFFLSQQDSSIEILLQHLLPEKRFVSLLRAECQYEACTALLVSVVRDEYRDQN